MRKYDERNNAKGNTTSFTAFTWNSDFTFGYDY